MITETALGSPLRWIRVPGGVCLYGDNATPRPVADLWWTATPVTNAQIGGVGEPDWPVTGLSHASAAALATALGGRLAKVTEWEWAASGPRRRPWPWGERDWTSRHARLSGGDLPLDVPGPVAAHPDGATPLGLLDMAGLVWEWTASAVPGGGHQVRGGSFASRPLYARTTFLNAAPSELCSEGIGLRVVRAA
ncbi:hypothetical protein Lfu02_15400 [Longispora fulva]|uniref:Iron(II)-dependent oxidoreductase n=1 Tax=Longispora fulva TaxID=619741 RepID=A0A8J7GVQ1_9ACTN|nr:SUMF1/EgtB/PvdO family nonheme iron enzyme [Longispora fulva]MBG6140450.1 iron(II)-dependent oxidoreductase [Longispora fulva]GIG57168.1 hypothetical protein Lfu02_15400 [Longispora fulva]